MRVGRGVWMRVLSKFSDALKKNSGSILRSQTPLSYPSQNKIAQSDVTAETALKSALLKMLRISKLDHSNGAFPYLIIEKND